jgi:hypothetical protein
VLDPLEPVGFGLAKDLGITVDILFGKKLPTGLNVGARNGDATDCVTFGTTTFVATGALAATAFGAGAGDGLGVGAGLGAGVGFGVGVDLGAALAIIL